jgi:NAD(P)-dependent dehydrogenase (short-subunit alcohol dehydrogenase family)
MTKRASIGENHAPPALVITGASSGIGHATAKLAVAQGWRVFGSVRKAADADGLKDEFGPSFTPLLFDVRDQPAIEAAVNAVHASLGRRTLNGLVNNAGIGLAGPILHQPLDEFRTVLDTNVLVPCSQAGPSHPYWARTRRFRAARDESSISPPSPARSASLSLAPMSPPSSPSKVYPK